MVMLVKVEAGNVVDTEELERVWKMYDSSDIDCRNWEVGSESIDIVHCAWEHFYALTTKLKVKN